MTEYEGFVCAPGDVGKIAIVVARFNKTITEKLLEGALAKLREYMVSEDQIIVARVPGAFEIPTIAERLAWDDQVAAIICLGCVIKGETPHDEYINSAVSQQIAAIGTKYCLPVVFGLLTCNTVEQALARSGQQEVGKDKALGEQPGNKGAEAAEVALEMLDLLGKLPEIEMDDEEEDEKFESLGRNSKRYLRGDFEEVDVDPDSLVDIDDDEDDEEKSWFVHGGSNPANRRPAEPRDDNRQNQKKNRPQNGGSDGKHHNKSGKSGFKAGGHDKKFKKGGASRDKR